MSKILVSCEVCGMDFSDEPNRALAIAAVEIHSKAAHGGYDGDVVKMEEVIRLDSGNVEYVARRSGKSLNEISVMEELMTGQMIKYKLVAE